MIVDEEIEGHTADFEEVVPIFFVTAIDTLADDVDPDTGEPLVVENTQALTTGADEDEAESNDDYKLDEEVDKEFVPLLGPDSPLDDETKFFLFTCHTIEKHSNNGITAADYLRFWLLFLHRMPIGTTFLNAFHYTSIRRIFYILAFGGLPMKLTDDTWYDKFLLKLSPYLGPVVLQMMAINKVVDALPMWAKFILMFIGAFMMVAGRDMRKGPADSMVLRLYHKFMYGTFE